MRLNYKIVIAMLVLAIFAVGSVSAAEVVADDVIDDSVDDVVIDDVPLSDSVQDEDDSIDDEIQTTRGYDVDDSMDSDTINRYINTTSTGVVNFTPGTYKSMALVLKDNVALYGNGATIYGNGTDNVFTITGKSNFTITGFNIIVNSTQKAAIYGSNVSNVAITDNTITGGKDGINIFQTYNATTITGNTISGVTRDAISLVNHKTFSDSEWSNWPSSVVSNNNITGGQYAMFFGGNFKGTISGNTITNSTYGMQFAGKKNETNGKLCHCHSYLMHHMLIVS
ncbi:right-handed parallel beta-helix repeat-containing protein [Methanobrevibacter sp. V74]|uniref:right-handed parallel beta-helix repeat-containing protein n=1 Tax=Methanobrevibacter sp. V74 TaxID=3064279 RepID=UPI00273679C3|nr:right-handed parallel beta-helix repeat-containing protein [Methanobrevibacter sp. V74]